MDIEPIEQPSEELLNSKDFKDYVDAFIKSLDEERGHNVFNQNLTGQPDKISNATYEIVFDITANVLEENEKGEKVRSQEICTKYYHIPVPLDGDYKIFMESFFKFLENCLSSAASKTYEATSPYKNQNKSKEQENG